MKFPSQLPSILSLSLLLLISHKLYSQQLSTPLYQTGKAEISQLKKQKLSLWDASRNDRWLGRSPENIRWSPDGEYLYFQWSQNPLEQTYEALDPWFRTSSEGQLVEEVPLEEVSLIPAAEIQWDANRQKAAWIKNGVLYLFDGKSKPFISLDKAIQACYFRGDELHFVNQDAQLFAYHLKSGFLQQLTTVSKKQKQNASEAKKWVKQQQLDLFDGIKQQQEEAAKIAAQRQQTSFQKPIAIPISEGWQISNIEQAPNKEKIIYSLRKNRLAQAPTYYMDYATASGQATSFQARAKVGEEDNEYEMRIMDISGGQKKEAMVVDYSDLTKEKVIFHGPYWNPTGSKALIQVSSLKHKDRWIGALDLKSGKVRPLIHDHDEAWLGGPEVVGYYSIQPVFLEWINDEEFVFASERTGFAHLYQSNLSGNLKPLTEGKWEVRQASLYPNRQELLVTAGKEDPCQDHLYRLNLKTGTLKKLSGKKGRNTGVLSPDGAKIALTHSETVQLPDLYWMNLEKAQTQRITVSGTKNYYQTDLVKPEIVQFQHKDGKPVWAALFKPKKSHPKKPAILHIHGGGYRQFSHKGWSVYGYAMHLSMINYLVQEGYTVLDLDYRGSAGFGRDYRTDIYRSMGVKDVESGLAGIDYLVKEEGIDPDRIGVYGISYGGFFTLMALFKHPGKFAAGIANASVADWAHYNHLWTSRILNLPYDDPEAYQISSPINHAAGLEDPLLIVHGIIDDNVHFQDAVRVSQRLIELEKDFEIMYYPKERHVIQNEAARLDYHKRLMAFFGKYLLR